MIVIVATMILGFVILCFPFIKELKNFIKMKTKKSRKIKAIDLIKDYALNQKDYVITDDEILRKGETRLSFISFREYLIFFKWYRGR